VATRFSRADPVNTSATCLTRALPYDTGVKHQVLSVLGQSAERALTGPFIYVYIYNRILMYLYIYNRSKSGVRIYICIHIDHKHIMHTYCIYISSKTAVTDSMHIYIYIYMYIYI
jgi:hypothetical protein